MQKIKNGLMKLEHAQFYAKCVAYLFEDLPMFFTIEMLSQIQLENSWKCNPFVRSRE